MDRIKDILSSDLLRRYVRGQVTRDEKIKVDLLSLDHLKIRKELERLQRLSCTSVKEGECIIKNMVTNRQNDPTTPIKRSELYKCLQLGLALILGGLVTWIWMRGKVDIAHNINLEQESRFETLQRDCDLLTKQYSFINHTNTLPVRLKGPSDNQVIVYWNDVLRGSKLRVIELPGIPSDRTYQLWAEIDGNIHNLGVFDAGSAILDAIPMEYLDHARSLFITIEPKGGSKQANMAEQVVGQVI